MKQLIIILIGMVAPQSELVYQSHQSKITIDYQDRNVFKGQDNLLVGDGSRGQVVVQYQIYI